MERLAYDLSPTKAVGEVVVRRGFSIAPLGHDGGKIRTLYWPQIYGVRYASVVSRYRLRSDISHTAASIYSGSAVTVVLCPNDRVSRFPTTIASK